LDEDRHRITVLQVALGEQYSNRRRTAAREPNDEIEQAGEQGSQRWDVGMAEHWTVVHELR
jgi:hypothetical protein